MRIRTLLAVLLTLLFASTALADGLIVVRPHPPEMPHVRNVPLWVKYHRVSVHVKGRVAVTEVDQVFVNPNPRRLEGTYLFPLPEGATIDRFSMWLDGKELKAELLDAAKARKIYEDIVRRAQDPALLEYAENRLFKARIFPIEPHGEKRVRISYAEVLPADNGTVAYRYPLNTEKFSSRPLEDVSVKVTIEDDVPIKAVYSPSHAIDAPRKAATKVVVGWEERHVKPDRDFLLYWRPSRKSVGISAVAHRDPGADAEGTFLLVLGSDGTDGQAAEPLPKDVVFVFDTSGSMAGQKMEQARNALRHCLRSLRPADRFAVVPFSTEARLFREKLATADAETIAAAEKFVAGLEARGGTAIDDALQQALGLHMQDRTGRPRYVLFLTDGLPTIGETDPERILKHTLDAAAKPRMFVFGVGNDVNTKLLDRLADQNGGTRSYVAETESIEEKVSNLFAKVSHPAMTDVVLKIEGVATSAVHPRKLGDLFHGSELLVAGRYTSGGNAVIRLTGRMGTREVELVEELRLPEKEVGNEFLPRLWAVRRVGFLLDEIRLRGESTEVKDEVVKLAKRYGIVTPYTSYLILEDEARRGPVAGGPRPGAPRDLRFSDGGGESGVGGGASAPEAPAAEREAFGRMRAEADAAGKAGDEETGEGSIELSKRIAKTRLYRGVRDDAANGRDKNANAVVRHLGGRTFLKRGGLWWEVTLDLNRERKVVKAFGEEYFALLTAHPEIGKYLKLGNVVLTVAGKVIEVRLPT